MITTRVQSLSYFDQHYVANQCSSNLMETINNFATGRKSCEENIVFRIPYVLERVKLISVFVGNSSYLPVQEHVAFLFDLMELSLNVDGLIDLCIMVG